MKVKFALLAVILLLAAPLAASADICEDINDMANGWNQMANGIADLDLGDLTDEDEEKIEDAVDEAFDTTREFADLLEDEGDRQVSRLGKRLNNALDDLDESETFNQAVDSIDSVVDALDGITDFCDEQ